MTVCHDPSMEISDYDPIMEISDHDPISNAAGEYYTFGDPCVNICLRHNEVMNERFECPSCLAEEGASDAP